MFSGHSAVSMKCAENVNFWSLKDLQRVSTETRFGGSWRLLRDLAKFWSFNGLRSVERGHKKTWGALYPPNKSRFIAILHGQPIISSGMRLSQDRIAVCASFC